MPFTRLFEVPAEPRDQWAHVVAVLLALTEAPTRQAFLAELMGEEVPGAESAQVSEFRPFANEVGAPVADVVVRAGNQWGIAIQCDLTFAVDRSATWQRVYDALDASVEKATLIAITPDRKPAGCVVKTAESGRDVRHRSWQRVRDWVQERPERGQVTGTDAVLLREADYFLQSRVAELYRLEEAVMPQVDPALRASFASLFFGLNDLSTQPNIRNTTPSTSTVNYPRTGDPAVTLSVGEGAPVMSVSGEAVLTLNGPDDLAAGRSQAMARAAGALPPKR